MISTAVRQLAIVVGAVLGAAAHSVAQTAPPNPHDAQPERPSVATHAWAVAPGWIEIEGGMEFDRYPEHTHGETAPLTAKIGLTSHAQLELQTPIVHADGLHTAPGPTGLLQPTPHP